MAIEDVTEYDTLVGRVQEGEKFFMKDGGKFEMAGGSELEMEKTTNFDFYSSDLSANEILNFIASRLAHTHHPYTDSLLSISMLVPGYGYHIFSLETGASKASIYLPLASKGKMLFLDANAIVIDAIISVSTDDSQILMNMYSVRLSALYFTAADTIGIKMVCETDGTWQIVEDGSVEQLANV